MDGNVSKSRRSEDDLISNLPDEILTRILSRLPTKNSVATSILSTRWTNVVPFDLSKIVIDLDDSLFLHPELNYDSIHVPNRFINFVDKLLNETLSDVPCVDTCILKCNNLFEPLGIFMFLHWIRILVRRLSVRDLRLKFWLNDQFNALFPTLNGCASLTRLELNGHTRFHYISSVGADFCLPALRALSLEGIGYNCDGTELMKFINGCPALEELCLTDCGFRVKVFCITSHVLKTLRIERSLRPGCHVTLNTPNLEVLILRDDVADEYCFCHSDSLKSAEIEVVPYKKGFEPYYETVIDLVYGFRSTRQLYVGRYPIKSLYHANNQPFPEFHNLTWLSLSAVRSEGWVVLAHLLNNAPKLVQLKVEEEFVETDMGFADFEQLVPNLPTCLELHMKIVEFSHFDKEEDENKLLDYFVKNGKVLEKVVLNSVVLPIKR